MPSCGTRKSWGSLLNNNIIIAKSHRRALRIYLQPLTSLDAAPRQGVLWAPLCCHCSSLPAPGGSCGRSVFCHILALVWDLAQTERCITTFSICSYFSQSPELVPLLWFTHYLISSPYLPPRKRLSLGWTLHHPDTLSQCCKVCPGSTAPVKTSSLQASTAALARPVILALHQCADVVPLCSSASCPGSGTSMGMSWSLPSADNKEAPTCFCS